MSSVIFDAMALHQIGHREVVALMGSRLSAAQEVLIGQYTQPRSQILVMLDEDDAGRTAHGEVAARLAYFSFVRIHKFEREGQQPEHLTADELSSLFA